MYVFSQKTFKGKIWLYYSFKSCLTQFRENHDTLKNLFILLGKLLLLIHSSVWYPRNRLTDFVCPKSLVYWRPLGELFFGEGRDFKRSFLCLHMVEMQTMAVCDGWTQCKCYKITLKTVNQYHCKPLLSTL